MFTYIWDYIVKEDYVTEFEQAYGQDGDWVKLFSKADGYQGTVLQQDISNPLRYITIDHWKSKEERDNFRKEFEAIDKRCEQFTEKEVFIGDFVSLSEKR